MRKAGQCPHCGGQLYDSIQRKRGRPLTAFYTLKGISRHKEEWAESWNMSIQLFNYYINRKKWTIEQLYTKVQNDKKNLRV